MAICPRCSKEMVADGNQMVCRCGYQYDLPERLPTYTELLEFIHDEDLECQLECWLEVKDEPL